jgi:mono/diheme cytochrome c family protein
MSTPPPPSTPAQPMTPLSSGKVQGQYVITHCAGCHDQSLAAKKGKNISLSNGPTVLRLDDKISGASMRKVITGEMPKGSKLSQEQLNGVINDLLDMMSGK